MGNFNTSFLEKTKEYVAGFIGENFTEKICYHNIDHTLEVVDASELIGKKCKISNKDLETVIIASWFHDTGYYLGCLEHEEASAKIASEFLSGQNTPQEIIDEVVNCILSTKIPQKPKTLLEKIICDADLYHLSTKKYFEKSALILRELKYQNQEISSELWLKESKDFIEAHVYHTSYGKKVLFPLLKKNLALLQRRIEEFAQ